jgi:Domain of unknown function (DUF4440)
MAIRIWLLVAVVCTTVTVSVAAVDARSDSARAEVLAAENARTAAFVSRDMVALNNLLRDDLTYVHSSGRTDTKKSLMDAIRSDELHYISWTSKQTHVRITGDTAVLDGEYAVKVINRAASPEILDMNVFFLTVYVRSGGRWQQMAWQTTKDMTTAANH